MSEADDQRFERWSNVTRVAISGEETLELSDARRLLVLDFGGFARRRRTRDEPIGGRVCDRQIEVATDLTDRIAVNRPLVGGKAGDQRVVADDADRPRHAGRIPVNQL